MKARAIAAGIVILLASPLIPGGEAEGPRLRAFRAARIVPVEGPVAVPGVLLLRGEKIEKILAAGDPIPDGTETVDLGDSVLIPALVNPSSTLIFQESYLDGHRGAISRGPGSPGDSRGLRASESVSPKAPALRRLGRSGYGAVASIPPSGSGLLGGIACVVRPRSADSRDKVILKDAAYLSMSYGLGQPMREIAERELGKAAAAWKKKKEEKEKAEKKEPPSDSGKKEAPPPQQLQPPPPPDPLVQVFSKELPAFVRIESAAALDHFLRIVDRLPEAFSFVLLAPPLEPGIVEKVAGRKGTIRAVILEPRLATIPDTSLLYNSAGLLLAAGVEVAVIPASDDLTGHGEVAFFLGELVKAGFPAAAALRAATIVPARLLGIEDRVGSLLPGREASFLALDGDLLSGRARILRIFIQGDEVYREDPATGKVEGEAVR